MFFTQEDYKKIEAWLYQRTVRDTELPEALPINGTERVPIIQDSKNRTMNFSKFVQSVISKSNIDFYNVSAASCKGNLSLEEAIALIPADRKRLGLVITFRNKEGNWVIYQFNGTSLNQWSSLESWQNIIYNALDELIFWPDEEDITFVQDGNKKLLKFRNREYDPEKFLGKGMIILRRNYQGTEACSIDDEDHLINLLTQDMISQSNTVYVIEYDFDLDGKAITIPENSVLWFQGGSINNGSIYLNKTAVLGAFEFADMGNSKLFGTFKQGQIMKFHNDNYQAKVGTVYKSAERGSSANNIEDPKQDDEVYIKEDRNGYVASQREELRWWNGEEWVLILDITDYTAIISLIRDLIGAYNSNMFFTNKYFKQRIYTLESKVGDKTVQEQIIEAIKKLNSSASKKTTHIDITVNQKEGKLSSIELTEDGIASDKELKELENKINTFLEDKDLQDSTINRWKELEDFLNGITDQETLLGLLEDLRRELMTDINNIKNVIENLDTTIINNIENYLTTYIVGNASSADKVNHKLKFTGAATAEYDGSEEITINIPESSTGGADGGTADKVKNKLIFTGAVTAEYDGSNQVTVDIPQQDDLTSIKNTINNQGNRISTIENSIVLLQVVDTTVIRLEPGQTEAIVSVQINDVTGKEANSEVELYKNNDDVNVEEI